MRVQINRDILLDMYTRMLMIRYFEEAAIGLFKDGMVRGPMHVYIGEEAVAVGACANLNRDDYITSTHRGHGHCIAKGGDPKKMMAELLGKATGYCKGKGGSMHIADPRTGILGANGIVAGSMGIATGAALSVKMQEQKQVTLCFFGDGATNQGIFHESLNLASVWQLPIVYICENNLYGLSGAAKKMIRIENIAERSKSYGFPGVTIDGNDVVSVYKTVKEAIERARGSLGPTLIEAKTYRWEGHFVGDPCVYRDKEEEKEWKSRCPIKRLTDLLVKEKIAKLEELEAIRKQVKREMEEVVAYAVSSPEPDINSVFDDIFTT